MKRTLFFKIFSGYLFLTILLSLLLLFSSFQTIKSYYLDIVTNQLKNLDTVLGIKFVSYVAGSQVQELDRLLKEIGPKIEARITVVDREGIVLADSKEDPAIMENHGTRPEIMTALRKGIGTSVRFSDTVNADMLYVAMPLKYKGKVLGAVRTSLFVENIDVLLGSLKKNIWSISLFILLLALLGAYIFSKQLSRPMRALSDASQRVAQGDFKARVYLQSKDELHDFANSFNYMADQVELLFKELSKKKEELAAVIDSIREGLLVLDKDDKIKMSNNSFREITGEIRGEGKYFWEVIKEYSFSELIKKVHAEKKNIARDLAFFNKDFLMSATIVKPGEEIVVTLHDISEIKKLERIKKDFIVNVSHELKTPLTAIKGFAETIEEHAGAEDKRYITIIINNTNRLINIVEDLLILSELEERGLKLKIEDISLPHLLGNIIKMFEPRAREKKLTMKLVLGDGLPTIKGDYFKLEQVFINLIDNAVKYTEKGNITISAIPHKDRINILIQDTGIGIASEHRERIFERFYVVDKSRSRKNSGTGLGLSIVKHIVLLHQGSLEVQSSIGQGTTFSVTLPVSS